MYKRKTSCGAAQAILEQAADEVINQKHHLWPVAKKFEIDKMTLYRYCKKKKSMATVGEAGHLKVTCGYSCPRQMFSETEESEIATYLLDASKMFFRPFP